MAGEEKSSGKVASNNAPFSSASLPLFRILRLTFAFYSHIFLSSGWSKDPGPSHGGEVPRLFLLGENLKELSIFIDESGDFGEYDFHSPYYIITMVFHNQTADINDAIVKLDSELSYLGLNNLCIHTGPIIRKEEIYKNMAVAERRRIFNKMMAFIRNIDIKYKSFIIEKKHINDSVEAVGKLSKQISQFVQSHYQDFLNFDDVKIYYDNGQVEVSKIISSVFNALLPNPLFKKVMPSEYKLFQAADFLCTMTLVNIKLENNLFSKSELNFFGNIRDLKRNYLKVFV